MSERNHRLMEKPRIDSVANLLAHAHRLEREAADRYVTLAEEMNGAGRTDLAAFFEKMAEIERRHVERVDDMAEALELPGGLDDPTGWVPGEGPETAHPDAATIDSVRGAILLAMAGEEAAVAFFEDVRACTRDVSVRRLAEELAAEERHHVALLRNWLVRLDEKA